MKARSTTNVCPALLPRLRVRRLSLLEQLLRGGLEAVQLQQHLRQAFPADAVEEQLRDYADKAWTMLGQTTLQVCLGSMLMGLHAELEGTHSMSHMPLQE